MKNFLLIFVACSLISSILADCSGSNFIQNGDFESTSSYCSFGLDYYDNCQISAPTTTSLPSWNVVSGEVDAISEPKWQAESGEICINMIDVTAGEISQQVSGLVVGNQYQLSFWMAGNFNGGNALKYLNVQVGSEVNVNVSFDITGASASNMNWQSRSVSFVATSTSANVVFTSIGGDSWGAVIDNVKLQACLTLQQQVQIFCPTASQNDWGYGTGYYCFNSGGGYGQCYGTAPNVYGSYLPCPAGTSCQCDAGVECSNHGTESPCQTNP